ncbi:MAG TPA: MFS transporter, partial [Candidatus Latescibacteria bacterium]|nr:MFS transporter [Candidatus Latescibacterota bacterium]
ACWCALGAAIWHLAGERPLVVLGVFIGMYAITTSLMGVSNVAWMDLVGKTVPQGGRARVFALRRMIGGGLAVASGAVIAYILSERSGVGFPRDYAVIFLIAAGLYAIASETFGLIREPIEPVRKSREPIRSYLAGGFRLLKDDDDYRRLFILRYLWATAMMGTSFYVPFAISDLGMNIVYIGLFVSVSQVSSVLSNALWARIGDRKGNRALLIYGTYFLAGSLLIPLSTPLVLDVTIRPLAFLGIPFSISTQVLYFSLTFLCNGFANSGMFTGRMALVLDLAPADRRTDVHRFHEHPRRAAGLLPILGGFLAAWLSYRDMFLISLAFIPPAIIPARRIRPAQSAS